MTENRNRKSSNRSKVPISQPPETPCVSIRCEGESVKFGIAELTDQNFLGHFIGRCTPDKKPIVNLRNLKFFEESELARLVPCLMRYSPLLRWSTGSEQDDPQFLSALSRLLPRKLSKRSRTRLLYAANLALAISSETCGIDKSLKLLAKYQKRLKLKDLRLTDQILDEWERLRKEASHRTSANDQQNSQLDASSSEFQKIFHDYPLRVSPLIPGDYRVTRDGVRKGELLVTTTPIVVLAEVQPLNENSSRKLRLLFMTRDGGKHLDMDYCDSVCDRKVGSLLNQGVSVFPKAAPKLAEYFSRTVSKFENALPKIWQSNHVGYVDRHRAFNGETQPLGFLYGPEFIPSEETTESSQKDTAELLPSDFDRIDLQKTFCTKGTLEGWLNLVRVIAGDPVARFMTVTTFVAPLLRILDQHSYTFSLACESGTGKTAALQIAASAWGNPSNEGSLIRSFQATENALFNRAEAQRDLPMFIDETTLVSKSDQSLLERLIYTVGNGVGRDRLKNGQSQSTGKIRTVVLVTGESSLMSQLQNQGALRRVLECTRQPFGDRSSATGSRVSRLQRAANSNYGHGGREFVRFLLKHKQSWSRWRSLWDEMYEMERTHLPGKHHLEDLVARNLATVRVANRLLRSCFPELRSALKGVVRSMRPEIYNSLKRADTFHEVLDTLTRIATRLANRATDEDKDAKWVYDRSKKLLWINSVTFRRFVGNQFDLDAKTVLKAFKQRGVLHQEPREAGRPGGRYAYRKRFGESHKQWYVFRISVEKKRSTIKKLQHSSASPGQLVSVE
ncbi:DUF927 domain-containing protein [Planctopirus hydrillae]|uniref:DUF927 domain-containing protein n=1 Tax=Planctopirus hydrillae TaxID=1841610 RepID=A0A1C3E908_9PLAN|nr:DUF927 domain-containing protein [Planctopirus hydrillae]ODA29720.1 hypothetical protein A6X21_07465 [Planctopirus hydrillae]